MVNKTAITPPSEQPLTPAHYRELALAQGRTKTIRKAARMAAFKGWTIGVLAALSAPFALFSVVGFLMIVGLSVVAYNEFRGRKRLLNFDPSSTILLGWNQIGLLALITVYSLWMLWAGLADAHSLADGLRGNPELGGALGSLSDVDDLYKQLSRAFYGSVIAFSVIVQGLTAYYYFSRRSHVEACVRETPTWVLDVERMTTSA